MVKSERHISVAFDINEPRFLIILAAAAVVLGPRVPLAVLLTLCGLEPHLQWRHAARVQGCHMYLVKLAAAPPLLIGGTLAASALPWALGAPAWVELAYGLLAWVVLRLGGGNGERLLHTYSGGVDAVSPEQRAVAFVDDIAVTSATHAADVMASALAHWEPFQTLRSQFEAAGSPLTRVDAVATGAPPFRFVFFTALHSQLLPYRPCYLLRQPTAAVAVWVTVEGAGAALVLKSEVRPCGRRVRELPAGIVEGEVPCVAAARELREELGLRLDAPLAPAAVKPLLPSVGGCNEELSLFYTPAIRVTRGWVEAVQALENSLCAEGEVGLRLHVVPADAFGAVEDLKAHAALATRERALLAQTDAPPLTELDLLRARAARVAELEGDDAEAAQNNLSAVLAVLEARALTKGGGLGVVAELYAAAALKPAL